MGILSMTRGDTKVITETVGPVGLGVNGITGWLFWFTAKYDNNDPDSAAVVQKTPGQWTISVLGNASTAGQAFCTLMPADTAGLPGHQVVLSYDIQAKDLSGNVTTLDSGTFTVVPDSTVATT